MLNTSNLQIILKSLKLVYCSAALLLGKEGDNMSHTTSEMHTEEFTEESTACSFWCIHTMTGGLLTIKLMG